MKIRRVVSSVTNNCNIHPDLIVAQMLAYEPNGFLCGSIIQDSESKEYGGCSFAINGKVVKFRVGKITPKKIGYFVTLWKRVAFSPITPYDLADQIDFIIISVRNSQNFGQFIFPKNALCQKGFISKEGRGGKRAMRVYPPWDQPDNAQATKAQMWQLAYFVKLKPYADTGKITLLLSGNLAKED